MYSGWSFLAQLPLKNKSSLPPLQQYRSPQVTFCNLAISYWKDTTSATDCNTACANDAVIVGKSSTGDNHYICAYDTDNWRPGYNIDGSVGCNVATGLNYNKTLPQKCLCGVRDSCLEKVKGTTDPGNNPGWGKQSWILKYQSPLQNICAECYVWNGSVWFHSARVKKIIFVLLTTVKSRK